MPRSPGWRRALRSIWASLSLASARLILSPSTSPSFSLADSGGQVVADLGDAGPLGGVGPEHRAADAPLTELTLMFGQVAWRFPRTAAPDGLTGAYPSANSCSRRRRRFRGGQRDDLYHPSGDRLGPDGPSGGGTGTSYLVLGGTLVSCRWPGNTACDDAGQSHRGSDGVSGADEARTRSIDRAWALGGEL
jgi:hypothetical protein